MRARDELLFLPRCVGRLSDRSNAGRYSRAAAEVSALRLWFSGNGGAAGWTVHLRLAVSVRAAAGTALQDSDAKDQSA